MTLSDAGRSEVARTLAEIMRQRHPGTRWVVTERTDQPDMAEAA